MRIPALILLLPWLSAAVAGPDPLDDIVVTPLPGPASCYNGTAAADSVIFLRTKVDQFECDFSGGGQICLNRREFPGDGANGVPISLGSPLIQRPTVSGPGDVAAFTELGFNACLMATGSAFDEGCAGRDLFTIDPHSFSINPAGTQVAMTRIDLGVSPNVVENEIYILNATTLVFEEGHEVVHSGNSLLQIETVDFTVDGDYLIIDAFDPVSGLWGIYAVDRSDSSVTAVVAPVAGLHIRNPSLAQTSDDHMVFDAQNATTGASTIFAADLLTGALTPVATSGLLSYPTYTGDDRAVVFSESDGTVSTAASLDIQYLATDRMTPEGGRSRWLTNGGAPAVYRRGSWDSTLKDPALCGSAASADLDLQVIDAEEGAYLPGGNLSAFTKVVNLTNVSSGHFDINYYLSTDTTITAGDTLMGTFNASSLGPAGELSGLIGLPIPGGVDDGDYFVGAILDIDDDSAANNVQHDPTAIRINSDAEIFARPLSLSFEQGGSSGGATQALEDSQFQDYRLPQYVDYELLTLVENEQMIRVLVGFETAFLPEGILQTQEKTEQRQAIIDGGQRLLNALATYNYRENARFQYIPFLALTVDEAALQVLMNSPDVISINLERRSEALMDTSNQVIGTPAAWAESQDGAGQAVAVLDTGVDNTHPWFNNGGSKVVSEACFSSNIPEQGATSWCPGGATEATGEDSGLHCDTNVNGCDHGTHVAGTAVGNDGTGPAYGVAREADLIAMQVFTKITGAENCGGPASCTVSYSSDQIKALERVYALRNTFDIAAVNMSLGGGEYADQTTCDAENGAVKAAIDNLRSVDIATVIAAGNSSTRDTIGAPACISTAISIGNTRRNDEISGSSSIYPQIHLLAPGTNINSSLPGTTTGLKTGTSMAAPHVAGAWAVMKQRFPGDSVSDILGAFQTTGTVVDDNRLGGTVTGMKRINLDEAIGLPRTTFSIFNSGPAVLNIVSIEPDSPAPWISVNPSSGFSIQANQMQVITIEIDFDQAPDGVSQRQLVITSNDPDESPLPDGVFINVTKGAGGAPEFGSSPPADSTLAFGDVAQSTLSAPMTVTVSNSGTATLTATCSLTGTHPGSFTISGCPINIAQGGPPMDIDVRCEPEVLGEREATLRLSTNDADESTVNFNLSCTGVEADEEVIFADGFE